MEKLIACGRLKYNTRRLEAGDAFEAKSKDAKFLILSKQATRDLSLEATEPVAEANPTLNLKPKPNSRKPAASVPETPPETVKPEAEEADGSAEPETKPDAGAEDSAADKENEGGDAA